MLQILKKLFRPKPIVVVVDRTVNLDDTTMSKILLGIVEEGRQSDIPYEDVRDMLYEAIDIAVSNHQEIVRTVRNLEDTGANVIDLRQRRLEKIEKEMQQGLE